MMKCLINHHQFVSYFSSYLQKKVHHLEDRKFASAEYLDPEIDERDSGPEPPISPLDQPFYKKVNLPSSTRINYPDKLNPSKSNTVHDKYFRVIQSSQQYVDWHFFIDFHQIRILADMRYHIEATIKNVNTIVLN